MKPFQAIIDWSQRHPHWWCRQMTWLAAIGISGEMVYDKPSLFAFNGFIAFVTIPSMYVVSRNAQICASYGSRWSSYFWFGMLWAMAVSSVFFLIVLRGPHDAAHALFMLAGALFQSFSMCKPPAPPKHRFQFAKGST